MSIRKCLSIHAETNLAKLVLEAGLALGLTLGQTLSLVTLWLQAAWLQAVAGQSNNGLL